jgi:hypothetical protein
MRPVVGVLLLRREPSEPCDLDVELSARGRREVNALHVAAVILRSLLRLLDGVAVWRHPRIAELKREPRPRETLPLLRQRRKVRINASRFHAPPAGKPRVMPESRRGSEIVAITSVAAAWAALVVFVIVGLTQLG